MEIMWGSSSPAAPLGLPAEPLLKGLIVGEIRWQHLERNDTVNGGVEGPPHVAHAAAAQQLDKAMASERRAVHISLPGNGGSADAMGRARRLGGAKIERLIGTQGIGCGRPLPAVSGPNSSPVAGAGT